VGRLAQRGHEILFEYDAAFIATGLALSPLGLPLRAGVQQEATRIFQGLHGLFYDSLPDGWGLRLMDREFARRGLDPAAIKPVERLQFLGTRAMGALTYHPAADPEQPPAPIDLGELAAQSERLFEGSPEDVLPALVRAGGSAAGARPKVLVSYDARSHEMRSGAEDVPAGFRSWLVKFPTKEDGADSGAVEMAYAAMARTAGIDMPSTRLFSAGRGRRCFGVERFDRIPAGTTTERRHVHTLGGLLHASHREFGCTYSQYLQAAAQLTHDRREVVEAFRRMVFNVLAYNRDDHVRNFAFLMEPGGSWRLSPAYDLVYGPGPGGEHSMMIGTEASRPAYRNFLEVAEPAGLSPNEVSEVVDRVEESVLRWPEHADEYGVSHATVAKVHEALKRACADTRPR
jgi:serine/threonine-protein kinase HipA